MLSDPNLEKRLNDIIEDPSYRLAFRDLDFMGREDLRPLRLELELLKPEMMLEEKGIESTIVVFGGTQVISAEQADAEMAEAKALEEEKPGSLEAKRAVVRAESKIRKSRYYEECRTFARIVSEHAKENNMPGEYIIKTGGGPGIMEAANRGAYEAGMPSIGLNITLPFEQVPNAYVTPGLCFQFNYFAIRKMHFLLRAKALICFPGGFGTLDEFFTCITLRQTLRSQELPIILYGEEYWKKIIDFQFLADEGVIRDDHLELFTYADTPEQTLQMILDYYENPSATKK